jgi:hypothetical protein
MSISPAQTEIRECYANGGTRADVVAIMERHRTPVLNVNGACPSMWLPWTAYIFWPCGEREEIDVVAPIGTTKAQLTEFVSAVLTEDYVPDWEIDAIEQYSEVSL